MAEVNANSLPAKTDLGSNDSAIVVDQTTNAGALVDLDVLADKVLDRISSKTFANQVGGSSAATLLAQLSTLNSNLSGAKFWVRSVTRAQTITLPPIVSIGFIVVVSGAEVAAYGLNSIRCNKIGGSTSVAVAFTTDGNLDGQTLTRNDPNEANFSAMLIYC